MGQALEAAHIVPEVLQKPAAVFEGLSDEADEDRRGVGWRCYAGIPPHSYKPDGKKQPPWEGEVFVVFLNDERVAYNWRWEKADPKDPKLPLNYKNRFHKRLL